MVLQVEIIRCPCGLTPRGKTITGTYMLRGIVNRSRWTRAGVTTNCPDDRKQDLRL